MTSNERPPSGFFDVVEVEVNNRCNRSCHYCPVSRLPTPKNMEMTQEVFDRLIANLDSLGFSGRMSYHRYSEPLLRKDLGRLVDRVRRSLPEVTQVIYTNGDLLSLERYTELLSAGAAQFIVTRHGRTPLPKRPHQVVLYPNDLILTNRGGLLGEARSGGRGKCFAPSEMLIVGVEGNVLLCYEDSRSDFIMGNIMVESVEEIWNKPRFRELRRLLAEGKRRQACSLCARCDNFAHSTPGRSAFMETSRGVF